MLVSILVQGILSWQNFVNSFDTCVTGAHEVPKVAFNEVNEFYDTRQG